MEAVGDAEPVWTTKSDLLPRIQKSNQLKVENRKISMVTYNCYSAMNNSDTINSLGDKFDILFLQEHWLFQFEKHKLERICPKFNVASKSVDEVNPICPIQKPRGYGGVAVLWRKELDHLVKPLLDGSERIQCLELQTEAGMLLLMSIYMPSRGKADADERFSDILDEITTILHKYSKHIPIIAGDFNVQINPQGLTNQSKRELMLSDFMVHNELVLSDAFPQLPTFVHPNGYDSTRIDYCLTRKQVQIISVECLDNLYGNSSDHHPVGFDVNVTISMVPTKSITVTRVKRVLWHKIDHSRYQAKLNENLDQLNLKTDTKFDVNCSAIKLMSCIETAALSVMPNIPKHKSGKLRIWNSEIAAAAKRTKQSNYEWKSAGRPTDPVHPATINRKAARKYLRSVKRREIARRRDMFYSELANAHYGNRSLYHRLIRKQQPNSQSSVGELVVNGIPRNNCNDICSGWVEHFHKLATPVDSSDYDNTEHNQVEYDVLTLQRMIRSDDPLVKQYTESQVMKAISKLNLRKAPDSHGLTVEHLRFGGPRLIKYITVLINAVMRQTYIPGCLKDGLITPVWKGKNIKSDPYCYRGITVTPVVGKVVEVLMKEELEHVLRPSQSKLQHGFTPGMCPLVCAVLLQEMLLESKANKLEYYEALLDAKSAFDVVYQNSLSRTLYSDGVRGNLWLMTRELNKDATSRVKWCGETSDSFPITQGVRQGGVLSTNLYKQFINPLLKQLENVGAGAMIGTTCIAAPTVADDISLAANNKCDLQVLLNLCGLYSCQNRYDLQAAKSAVLDYNKSSAEKTIWSIRKQLIPRPASAQHLGLVRDTKSHGVYTTTEQNIKKGRGAAYRLLGAGLHGRRGLPPNVLKKMVTAYVLPVFAYGLEVVLPTPKQMDKLESEYKRLLINLLGLPNNVASIAPYLLLGLWPIQATIEMRALSLFRSMCSEQDSISFNVIQRQLVMKNPDASSWVIKVNDLLSKYDLPSAFQLLDDLPTKFMWKRRISAAISSYWTKRYLELASMYSSLKFNYGRCNLQNSHFCYK